MSDIEIMFRGAAKLIQIWGTLFAVGVALLIFIYALETYIKKAQRRGTPKGMLIRLINFLLT